jgi:diguanylate cyclase (GGDEF)-like protein/PAS domain S-box-containing protein
VGFEENELRRKDGTTFPVEVGVGAIEYGGRRLIFASARDLTERKRAEEALKESEERYRAVIAQSVEAIYLYDAETKQILESNEAFRRMMGYSEGELLGLQIYDFIDHNRENIDANIRRSLKEKRRQIGERRYRRKDGSVIVVDTSASVISYHGKTALCAVSRDVTERKRLEDALRERERRFRSLIQNASDIITILGEDGIIRYDSPAIERVLGYTPEERLGKSAFEYMHPDDVGGVERSFAEALEDPGVVRPPVEFRLRHKDGSWRHVEATRTNLLEDPAVRGVVANSRDVTERKRAEEALKESEERHRAVVEQSVEGIYLFDPRTKRVLESNTAFEKLLGYTAEELSEMSIYDFIAHEREDIDWNVERHLMEGRRFVGERKYRRKDGTLLDVEASAVLIPYHGGETVCAVVRDVTERKALEEQLRHRAFHDPLTELPNRALLLDRLEHALARSGRLGEPVAVLFVDLDDFKGVNDTLGHEMGDRLLVEVAERLRSCVRLGDTAARVFGDEFAVLLEAPTNMEGARRVGERITEKVRIPFALDGRELFVSSTVGIVLGDPSRKDRPESVLRRADLAMYAAKSRGKDRSEVFNPSMDIRASERMELESDLRGAIEREEFEVHYQPLVDLRTDRIHSLEALVRWRHPRLGLIAAEVFIWLAEETGLIRSVGRWAFEEACRQAKRWNEQPQDERVIVCVNFSASQFARQADLIPKVLADTGLDPRALAIEITERAVMDDAEFALGKLRRLKDLGLSFGIDDYGTGYSCLRYLKIMPVDFLKIDRSFIAGLGEDRGDEAIVSGTINLAHALGLRVVAEGVETAEQLSRLEKLNCDLGQGLHLHEPLTSDEVSDLLVHAHR